MSTILAQLHAALCEQFRLYPMGPSTRVEMARFIVKFLAKHGHKVTYLEHFNIKDHVGEVTFIVLAPTISAHSFKITVTAGAFA